MMWEAAIDADQLVLYLSYVSKFRYTHRMLPQRTPPPDSTSISSPTTLRPSSAVPSIASRTPWPCSRARTSNTNVGYFTRVRYTVNDIPKPLSCLATCRQIHDEASRLVSRNVHVHICNNPRIVAAPYAWSPPFYKDQDRQGPPADGVPGPGHRVGQERRIHLCARPRPRQLDSLLRIRF